MSVYIITGGTTGIGAAVRTTLLDQGHEVFNIDLKEGDFLADLSKSEERQNAIEAVKRAIRMGLTGFSVMPAWDPLHRLS